MTPVVSTVSGPKPVGELGAVLMHEHIFVHTPELCRDFPAQSWGDRAAVHDDAVAKLTTLKDYGFDTLVDLTAIGCDRSIADVAEVNRRVDVNIIVATGLYTFDELPRFITARPASNGRDVMTDLFVQDITEGIAGTDVRAGVLKCFTDRPGLTPNVARVLTATARAHRETGVPISTHTDASRRTGLLQQDLFAAEGVDLTRVVIGHCGDSTDRDYLREIMDRGSTIGCDRFGLYRPGTPTLAERIDVIADLCGHGYADRIVISHDAHCHSDWFTPSERARYPDWNYTHIPDVVLPALRERGVNDSHIQQMLIANPRQFFSACTPY